MSVKGAGSTSLIHICVVFILFYFRVNRDGKICGEWGKGIYNYGKSQSGIELKVEKGML